MRSASNFAWGTLDVGAFVMIHDKSAPSDSDWDACIGELASYRARAPRPCALILTDGGAPTGAQRRRLDALVSDSPPTAVVSDAVVVRFVVASLALMNASIATFSSREIVKAWRHLGVGAADAIRGRTELRRIAETLSPTFVTLRNAIDAHGA
ncbi:MAG: hypothetical protein KF729_26790 [Sandaracinaceae bacterium]|nr:hypothetical protein [Sandaracinaceae bacterium]